MSDINRAKFLTAFMVALLLGACVSSQTVTRRVDPSDDATIRMFELGAQYYRNGNYNLARDRLERAIQLDSRNAEAHSLLALTLVKLGNNRLAAESFSRSIRLEPNSKDVRNAYGIFLCEQGRYDDALEQFDRAIGIVENDTSWIEMTNAGVCVAKKPDPARAEEYFRDALELRPAYGEALIQMAALKFRGEDFLAARAFLQRYLAANPSSAPVLYLGVQIETSLGDQRAAADYQDRLTRNFPESTEAKLLMRQQR
jgi:type IV pilus assembly protein PilF